MNTRIRSNITALHFIEKPSLRPSILDSALVIFVSGFVLALKVAFYMVLLGLGLIVSYGWIGSFGS